MEKNEIIRKNNIFINQTTLLHLMSIPIPFGQKPIQLYLWSKCGYCTKQNRVISSMNAEMVDWFHRNVNVTTVEDPKSYPMIRGYPH